MELGSDEGSRGTYDFSDDMRSWPHGMMLGAEWYIHKQWGAYADDSRGITGIFRKHFDTIEQTLYTIYGT